MESINEMAVDTAQETASKPDGQAADLKAARKHFSSLGLHFFLGMIVIYAVQLLPAMIVGYVRPEWLYNPNISISLSMIPLYLVGMPALIALVRRVPAEHPERHRMKAGHFVLAVIMCFSIIYLSNLIGNVFTYAVGLLKGGEVENVALTIVSSINIFLVIFYTVICAPIYEEYIFRKLIVDRAVRYGQGVAVVLSGLMFGLFHGNLNQFAYAFTMGVFMAFLYVKTGNLKIAIAIHMLINTVGGVVSSLLLKLIDMEELLRLSQSFDLNALTEFAMENLPGLLIYFAFDVFVYGMMIAGGVLFIVFLVKKRFTLSPGQVIIPKGKRFRTVILNVGMILFCLFWIVMIIIQLLS